MSTTNLIINSQLTKLHKISLFLVLTQIEDVTNVKSGRVALKWPNREVITFIKDKAAHMEEE